MTVEEFLGQLTDALEADERLTLGQDLAELEMWDSLGILGVVDLYEQIGVEVDLDRINEAKTTDDLVDLAGPAVSQ